MAIRGTTPDYTIAIPDYDLTDKTVHVTITQHDRMIDLTGDELKVNYENNTTTILFSLTQENTLYLKRGTAQIQVKFIDSNGKVYATDVGMINIELALLERVIVYERADD